MSKPGIYLVCIIAISAVFILSCDNGSRETYKFAILPQYSDEVLREKFQPLTDYLSAETGQNIELVFAPDFETHAEWVKSGEVDFAYQNPVVFSKCMGDTQLLAMALKDPRKGSERDKFRGIALTRVDEEGPVVPTLEDLPGHKVCVVSYISAGGYVSQMITLGERDIDESAIDFFEAEGNEQENVLLDVYEGRADAGFVRATTWGMIDDELEDPDKLAIIGHTAWLPNWAFSAHSSVDEGFAGKVKDALFKLEPGSAELTAAKLTGFTEPDPEEYSKLKKFVK